jgi:hypothetical protein
MENASKALLMAAGVLIGILILTLMVTLFLSAREVSSRHDQVKKTEEIEQFNANFTKYVGKDITIHQVITIQNFAKIENNKIKNVILEKNGNFSINTNQIENDIKKFQENYIKQYYKINITEIDDDGYVSKVTITKK